MKFYTFSLLAFATFLNLSAFAQTTGEYRSRQSGDWNDYNTWEQWDGSNWVTEYPNDGFPVVAGTATSAKTNQNNTTHAISLPSGIQSDDLILIFWSDGTQTGTNPSLPGEYTQLYSSESEDSYFAVWYKIADGTEGATVSTTNSFGERSAHVTYRVAAGSYIGTPYFASAIGSNSSPNPPSLDPGQGSQKFLWLASAHANESSDVSSIPGNFNNELISRTTAGVSSDDEHAQMVTAQRFLEGNSEDPASFSLSQSMTWAALTIALEGEVVYTPISYPQIGSAFPVVAGTAVSAETSNTTSHDVSLPSGIQSGDLLLVFWADRNNSSTATFPSGWTELYNTENSGNRHICMYRIADGSESSPITVSTTEGVDERSAHNAYRITTGTYSGIPVAGTIVTSSNANPNPPSLSSGFGDVKTLWLAAAHARSNSTYTAIPSNYSDLIQINTGADQSNDERYATMGTARRYTETSTEDPETFTISQGSQPWGANTIAIQGAPTPAIATILSTHTVTVTANVTVDETTIESGGELVINNGIIFTTPAGGVFSNEMGGLISGTGTLDFSDDTFTNDGTIDPGFSPGVLKIDNDFVNNGILNIEITGPPTGMGAGPGLTFDQLEIDGTAEINGTINIDFGMYVPMAGDEYQIIFSKAPGYSGMPTINVINDVIDVTYVDGLLTLLAPLPVTWLSFHAKAEGKEVFLTWSTASEQNNEGFDVQRSTNGRDWTTLGFVAGAGNSNRENHYSYTDKTISVIQPYYYRLAQMDYDGTIEYSPVRVVELSNLHQAVVNVFPNPAIDQITISFSEPTATSGTARFYDQKGRVVSEQVIAPQTNNYNTSVSELPAGMYLLEVKVGEIEWTNRIVVK